MNVIEITGVALKKVSNSLLYYYVIAATICNVLVSIIIHFVVSSHRHSLLPYTCPVPLLFIIIKRIV